jgi:hypothetical protein
MKTEKQRIEIIQVATNISVLGDMQITKNNQSTSAI